MIYIPKINPVRIIELASGQNLPQDLGSEFYGVDYVNFCNEWPIDKPLIFQFFSDTASPSVTVGGISQSLTDITPVSWAGLGSYVYEVSYTPTDETEFRFLIIEGGHFFESDPIKPVYDTSHLIKLEYSNSKNDYGYVGSTVLTAYVDGEYRTVQPVNEMTVYENDRAEMTKLRSTPTETYELNIYNTIYAVANMLNLIFSCDNILINGQPFQTDETPSVEAIEMSNLFNVNVVISRTNDDYQYFNKSDDGLKLVVDNTNLILTDNNGTFLI